MVAACGAAVSVVTCADIDALFKSVYEGIDVADWLERTRPQAPVVTEIGTVRWRGMEFRLLSVEPPPDDGTLRFEVDL